MFCKFKVNACYYIWNKIAIFFFLFAQGRMQFKDDTFTYMHGREILLLFIQAIYLWLVCVLTD